MRRVIYILCLVALALNASATTRVVTGSIRQGMEACQTGDTLIIPAGVYNEAIVLKEGVTVIGGYTSDELEIGNWKLEIGHQTILDGAGLKTRLISCEADCKEPTVVENLVLQNARHDELGGAAWLRGKVTMRNCVVRGCSGQQCGGVLIQGNLPEASALGARLEDCLIHNCSATGHYWPDAGGVANSDGIVRNCIVANCYGKRYGGIHSESSVYDCTFWGNTNEYGFVDPANYVSDESESGINRADEGFEDHFFNHVWLNRSNEAEDGPHFVDPATFAGVPENEAEEAIMLAADYSVGEPSHRIAAMSPSERKDPYKDYVLYEEVDYTVPSFIEFLQSGDSSVLRPKEDPYCVVATINGDPRTKMGFCWFTNEGVKKGEVQIFETSRLRDVEISRVEATATTTPALHYAISSSGILDAAKIDKRTAFRYVSHKAVAEGLRPGTDYCWRVGYEGHWSEWRHFRTADKKQGEFSFIYMTDSHIQNKEYVDAARLCAEAVARNEKEARFCVFPGDFVDTGTENNSEWEWERWFEEVMAPVLEKMPLVPTDGNHDDTPLLNYSLHFNTDTSFNSESIIRPQFAGINYSFVYGDMQLIAFSMQDFWRGEYDYTACTSEYLERDLGEWFRRQVAKAPKARWRVGLVHKNLYSGAGHQRDKESPLLRATMEPVMKDCHIDLVLQGHDHCYEFADPHTGTLYFIGATCGAKRYEPLTREEMEEIKHIHHIDNYYDLFRQPLAQPGAPSYTRVTVNKKHLKLETFKVLEDGRTELYNTIIL